MADSHQMIDWDEVRGAALDCLNATWDMVWWTKRSQEDNYDVDGAALHLAAIDTARDTFRRSMEVLQPGFERATDDSNRYSPVFDALTFAIAARSERPDFRYGPVCCATAHEAAFELLRSAILWIENGLNDELDELGAPDHHVASIDDLHKLTPEELRVTLSKLERRQTIQTLIQPKETKQIRVWIDQEWAAVSTHSRMRVIVLKSGDIRERYHLTAKQIRDWAKDERKPFIKLVAGQRKYEINPDHPELVALMK